MGLFFLLHEGGTYYFTSVADRHVGRWKRMTGGSGPVAKSSQWQLYGLSQ